MGADHTLYTYSHRHFGLDDAFERSVALLINAETAGDAQTSSGKGPPTSLASTEEASTFPGGRRIPSTRAAGGGSSGDGRDGNATAGSRAHAAGLKLHQEQQQQHNVAEGGEVPHPCLHSGYRQPYKRIPLDGKPPLPGAVTLVGRPDYEKCVALASAVVTAPAVCDAPPCALGVPQPRFSGQFVALTGFYVVLHFFKLAASEGLRGIRTAGQSFCGKSWAEVQAAHAGEMAVETYCFRAPYIEALASQGLHLSPDKVRLGEAGPGWTLGAALAEGHRLAGLGTRASGVFPLWSGVAVPMRLSSMAWAPAPRVGLLAAALLVGVLLIKLKLRYSERRSNRGRLATLVNDATGTGNRFPWGGIPSNNPSSGDDNDPGKGQVPQRTVFQQLFGVPRLKKTPLQASNGSFRGFPSVKDHDGSDGHEGAVAVGRGGMSRSQTYARRLSSLEAAA